ncbi:JAB domain-containing protein [Novosphingobium sp. BL-8H]|uniref:JAB domain-containing protein n=1 Tax=Novosphingobium sp. BL-8H TaxID=3127640 RepID=UPI003756FD1C
MALRLIRAFGSLRGIYSAPADALAEAIGNKPYAQDVLAAAIAVARDIGMLAMREALYGEPTEPGNPRLRRYLVRRLSTLREECVLILYLTAEGLFIAEDFYPGAQCSMVTLPLRSTVRRGFDLNARRLVIAHNHPSGNPEPSAADLRATRHCIEVLSALEFALDDHIVVGTHEVVSMRDRGLI